MPIVLCEIDEAKLSVDDESKRYVYKFVLREAGICLPSGIGGRRDAKLRGKTAV